MESTEIDFRELAPEDTAILRESTLMNINWSGQRFTLQDVLRTSELAHYTVFKPHRGDYGIVALQDQQWVGVVWVLYLPQDAPGFGFVASDIGELSVCVRPGMRGAGLGTKLIQHAIALARLQGKRGLSLSVEEGNPARKLYEKCGFADAGEDTESGTMILKF